MTIHVITPVHNRVDVTQAFIDDLCRQSTDEEIAIYIINDGSTDGTSQMLADKADDAPSGVAINVITGDGNWWWSRSMNAGIDECVKSAAFDDVVVFMNDDIRVPSDALKMLCAISREQLAIVAAQVNEVDNEERVLDRGALLDGRFLALQPIDLADELPDLVPLDIASGRTTAFPASIFLNGLRVDAKRLPHYVADIEFSIRAREQGFPILLSTTVRVLSRDEFGVNQSQPLLQTMFAVNSPSRLQSLFAFWATANQSISRTKRLLRFFRYHVGPNLLKMKSGWRDK